MLSYCSWRTKQCNSSRQLVMTCNASGRQHIWTSQAPSTISINNYLSRISFILPLLCYSLVLTFYLRHSSTSFLSPLICLNSSILGLTFPDLLSENEHSDVNTNCSYLAAVVLKSLSLLLIVRHCVHIVLCLCLLISLFGWESVFISPLIFFRFHPRASNTGGSYCSCKVPTLPCISFSRRCHFTWSSTGLSSLSGTPCNWRPEKIPWFCSEQDLFVWDW